MSQQQLENYMYQQPQEIFERSEKVEEFIEGSKENKEFAEGFKKIYEDQRKISELLSKYKGNPSVYKPEEVGGLIGLSLQLNQHYEGLREAAIKGLPTKEANEAGKELYEKVAKTKKALETALKQILKERKNEILRFYKEQAAGQLETYNTIEKEISRYVK